MENIQIEKATNKQKRDGFWDLGIKSIFKGLFWAIFGGMVVWGFMSGIEIYREGITIKVPVVQEVKAN